MKIYVHSNNNNKIKSMNVTNISLTYDLKKEINKWIQSKNVVEGSTMNISVPMPKKMIKYIDEHKNGNRKKSKYVRDLIYKYIRKLTEKFGSPIILFPSRSSFINAAILDFYLNNEFDGVITYMMKNGYTKIIRLEEEH